MSTADAIIRSTEAEVCRPWLRHIMSHAGWIALARAALAESWILLGHWADTLQAHALFLNPASLVIVPVSTAIEDGKYPALSPILPIAAWYERMIRDLWGHEAEGSVDSRPWLNHGNWPATPPMAGRPALPGPYDSPQWSYQNETETTVLPLGPIWGRLEEAAHLRLVLHGPIIRHAEARLGFSHKGILDLMRGRSPRTAARFVARLSADATVAHSVAFARAAEAAMDVTVPPRALGLRLIMQEIERVAVHLDNLAEVGRLAGSKTLHTQSGYLRELLLRVAETCFGHRLMMDCVVPGGVALDMVEGGGHFILHALGEIASGMKTIRRLHQNPSLASRLAALGRIGGALVAALGVGGVVGRASGHLFDVRTVFAPDYRDFLPRIAGQPHGDAAARQQVRMLEIDESLRLIELALQRLPTGAVTATLPQVSGEGIACAESARGDVWHWLRLDHGQVVAAFPRDPGWILWPLAESILPLASADDVDLIRASLALPASGMDL